MSEPKEVVLPSGRYARLTPVLYRDILAAQAAPKEQLMAVLVARCVTFDGKSLTVDDVLGFEFEEIAPVAKMLGDQLERANLTRNGIA